MTIYTRKGDDGTTGLLHGGRVPKDSAIVVALGDLDEAQAVIGIARALTSDRDLHATLTRSARTLWSVMAFVAENPNREHMSPDELIGEHTRELEAQIDAAVSRFPMPTDFVIPGPNQLSAALDVARAVVRRAERSVVGVAGPSSAGAYLNRLADLLWALARVHGGEPELAKRGITS